MVIRPDYTNAGSGISMINAAFIRPASILYSPAWQHTTSQSSPHPGKHTTWQAITHNCFAPTHQYQNEATP